VRSSRANGVRINEELAGGEETVGVLTVGVQTIGVQTIGVLTVGVQTIGVLTVGDSDICVLWFYNFKWFQSGYWTEDHDISKSIVSSISSKETKGKSTCASQKYLQNAHLNLQLLLYHSGLSCERICGGSKLCEFGGST
jgi:hypothetical protein